MGIFHRIAAVAALGGALAACTSTEPAQQQPISVAAYSEPFRIYPIVSRFGNGDVLTGASIDNPIEGTYPLRVRSPRSGISCEVFTSAPTLRNRADQCLGQEGNISLSCDDGREVETTWQAESCTSGYGVGTDSLGNRVDVSFGVEEAVALAQFNEQQEYETAALEPAEGGLEPIVVAPGSEFDVAPEGEVVVMPGGQLPSVEEPNTASVTAPERGDDYYASLAPLANGTGFFVTSDGYLVTNYHVVTGADVVGVQFDNQWFEAYVEDIDLSNDLAVLKVDAVTTPLPIPAAPNYRRGAEVMTLGYPLADENAAKQKATFGRINDLSGLQGDSSLLQIDVPIQPGNSGGPLLNTYGEVVGIVSSTRNALQSLVTTGTVPQNVNYAVKADYLRPLIGNLPSPYVKVGAGQEMDFSDLAELYENSVVLIFTWKESA